MRKSNEVIGLLVVSIEEGDEIGVVGHIIPNVINGTIAGLALKRRVWHQQPLVIPFSFVVGMSSEALTIENKSAVYPLSQLNELEEMLANGNEIIGLRVITKDGEMLGRVSEFLLDNTGCITQYQLENSQDTITCEQVVTIGKKMLVVDGDVAIKTSAPSSTPRAAAIPRDDASPPAKAPAPQEEAPTNAAERLRQLVGEKQEESILGKPSGRTLMAESGAPIIRKGEEVTPEIVAKAKKANRFAELVDSTRIPQS